MARAAELKVIEPPAKAALQEACKRLEAIDAEIADLEAQRIKIEADGRALADLEAQERETGKVMPYEARRSAELNAEAARRKLQELSTRAVDASQRKATVLRALPALRAEVIVEDCQGLAEQLEAHLRAARALSAQIRGARLVLIDQDVPIRAFSMRVPDDHSAQILTPADHAAVVAAQADWRAKL